MFIVKETNYSKMTCKIQNLVGTIENISILILAYTLLHNQTKAHSKVLNI